VTALIHNYVNILATTLMENNENKPASIPPLSL